MLRVYVKSMSRRKVCSYLHFYFLQVSGCDQAGAHPGTSWAGDAKTTRLRLLAFCLVGVVGRFDLGAQVSF